MRRYSRVVVKLSGEALSGEAGWGTDPASLAQLADEILSVHDLGVQIAVVIGGGNYFRGRMAEGWGIGRAEADNIGMLGTVMNALMLRGVLTARSDTDVRVMTAMPMQSVAEPFIRLRADRHLRRDLIVLLAGGIGQPYVTTDYPAVQRALELDADALLVAKRGVDGVYDSDPNLDPDASATRTSPTGRRWRPGCGSWTRARSCWPTSRACACTSSTWPPGASCGRSARARTSAPASPPRTRRRPPSTLPGWRRIMARDAGSAVTAMCTRSSRTART
jgi:uridylate kinase